ncbi:MAG: FliA/WhiG family RNA polymerase sigma factor [Planctomycetes bacterium]|nr:FliA/WhiG family RNA polymerase sigma factor [Planctomycetota bacterium]
MSTEMLAAYHAGRPDATELLVKAHLPLVRRVVGRLAVQLPPEIGREDLEEIGILGLLTAAKNFDPSRGASFKTFAYIAIQGAILDELRRVDVLPRGRRDGVRAFEAARQELAKRLNREPTFLEIQEELGLTAPELEEVLRSRAVAEAHQHGTGEACTGVNPESFAGNASDDPARQAELNEAKELLAAAIDKLPAREKQVVLLYYHAGLLLRDIGGLLEITESRVSQILQHALVQLNQRVTRKLGASNRETSR